ncbi:LysR family transcriptional regulator [Fulvimarina sp. 2208YS6-2-32]|uniref:LysR family transcriptional regulator n=1 Tax=Fulvimarina uroteuthidis TaxID=3098149 RepID=A0ABU5I603_9HYPH|nr:LysR family transcriptional regulator [Fulvimarina sp. 2208YS6-2-32]MDY8110820.1 LysR family transcriptional regulator [Fulvimarina sp. 2208YS6-2-32]
MRTQARRCSLLVLADRADDTRVRTFSWSCPERVSLPCDSMKDIPGSVWGSAGAILADGRTCACSMHGDWAMELYLRSLRPVQLRLVAAIERLGKLSLAAHACGMTVPAASRMLSEIEGKLGVALFERDAKGMTPTPPGKVLGRCALKIVHEIDQMAHDFMAHHDGAAGSVRIGAVTGAALAAVIPATLQMKQRAPFLKVSLDVSSSSRLMWGLERGEFDFAICRVAPGVDAREFEVSPARDEAVLLMVRRQHALAHRDRLLLAEIADLPWTMQEQGAPIRHAIEIAFRGEGVDMPRDLIETASVVAIMALLRDSDIIAAVTQEVADLLLRPPFSADLTLLKTLKPIIIEPYHVLRPRDRSLSAGAKLMLSLVKTFLDQNGVTNSGKEDGDQIN